MKKLSLVSFFLLFIVLFAFSEPENQDEVDYLLFLPNSGSLFVNEAQAMIQLDNLAKYLLGKNLTAGQIYVYGYAAFAENDIDPVHLSRERALFVISELQKRGISRNLFSAPVGHGSVDLWGGNADNADRSLNRRVRVILDGNIVTPETIKESESEIIISSADDREPVGQETKTKKSGAKLPLWLFILLHFLALITVLFFFLSKYKKSGAAKQAEPVKAEPVKTEPVKAEPMKAAPTAADVIIGERTAHIDEDIRLRAYELYLERGGQDGDADGDWHRAVTDVCAKNESAGLKTYFDGEYWRTSKQETDTA